MKEVQEGKFASEEALYQTLNLIFYAMVGVPLLFFLYLYLEIKDGKFKAEAPDEDIQLSLLILIPIFCFILIGLSYFFHRKVIHNVPATASLQDKLQAFYKGSIHKYALLEAASLLSLIGLFLTSEMVYVALYLIVLLVYSINRPTPYRFRKDMKIKTFPPSKGV